MGTDASLYKKATITRIDVDRKYNIINLLSDRLKLSDKMQNEGLTVEEWRDYVFIFQDIHNYDHDRRGRYDLILEELAKYNDEEVFILVDENAIDDYLDKYKIDSALYYGRHKSLFEKREVPTFNLSTRADFGKLAQLHYQTGMGAEIGVQYGVNAERIGKDYHGRLLCVDLWGDEEIMTEAVERLQDPRFTMIREGSLSAVHLIGDAFLDFVYIDANHHYDEVLADIRAWYPKVRSGGIIAGHDYCIYEDIEVIRAVDDWAREAGYDIQVTSYHEADCWQGTHFPTWWTIKK